MRKSAILIFLLFAFRPLAHCQQYPVLVYHSSNVQIVNDLKGTSKGWEHCDLLVKFYMHENKMDSITILDGAKKFVGIGIKERKAGYKLGNAFWDIYLAYDDEIMEDLQVNWGVFEKPIGKQVSALSIKYTDFTINLKLESLPK